MKTKIILISVLFFIVHCTLNIENCVCQWVQMSGGMGNDKTIRALTASGGYIYAGTYDLSNPSGVWISTNNGSNWSQTSLNSMSALALTARSGIIFAGAWNNPVSSSCGVYRSINNGGNWSQSNLTNKTVSFLIPGVTSIYAATNTGVYVSSDSSGAIWYQTALNSYTVYSIAVRDYNIYAGTYSNGLQYSTSNGTTWTQIGFNNQNVYSVTLNGNYIIAGVGDSGVWVSSNNGTNWIHSNLNNYVVESFAVSGNYVFAGASYGGVWLSTNNGINWIQKNQGFSTIPRVYALLIANNYIYAGTQALSVYRRLLSDIILDANTISSEIPFKYSLLQNYPNPFNSMTNVKWQMLNEGYAKITVYDILGKVVAILVNEKLKAGEYEVSFDGNNFSSGIYFYKLETGDIKETKKMIMLK